MRIIDQATNSIVFDAEWDLSDDGSRNLYTQAFDEILSDRDYALLLRFDKPMRYRDENNNITP